MWRVLKSQRTRLILTSRPTRPFSSSLTTIRDADAQRWRLAFVALNSSFRWRAGSRSYWKIFPYIAQETRNYVPNILAAMLIAKNPQKYGFHSIRPDAPLAYDIVQVPSATSLHLIAQVTNVSIDYIRMLNPELRRDTTPRGESYQVRIPGGKANQFVAALKGDRKSVV